MSEDIRVEFVGGTDADEAEIDDLTRALREEILQVEEVDHVEQASAGPAPEDSKAFDIAAIGALIVGIAPGVQAAGKVIEVVRNWLAARGSSAPPMQMTVNGKSITVVPTDEQRDALVDAFIASLESDASDEAGEPPTEPPD
jgi:hypothetical protein